MSSNNFISFFLLAVFLTLTSCHAYWGGVYYSNPYYGRGIGYGYGRGIGYGYGGGFRGGYYPNRWGGSRGRWYRRRMQEEEDDLEELEDEVPTAPISEMDTSDLQPPIDMLKQRRLRGDA
jgi:hypothetical protein